jgi:hypothetical protein
MGWRQKLPIILFLVIWTTGIAWFAASQTEAFAGWIGLGGALGGRVIDDTLTKLVPFFAPEIAVWQAFKVLRRKKTFDADALLRYFLGAPAWIFLAMLIIISLSTWIFAPITFIVGLIVGLLPLLAGIAVHCVGMVPLYFWLRT